MNILKSELHCGNCWCFEPFEAQQDDDGHELGFCRLNPPTNHADDDDDRPPFPVVCGVNDFCFQIKPIKATTHGTEDDQPMIPTGISNRGMH